MFGSPLGRLRLISIIEGFSYMYLLFHSIYSKRMRGIEDAIETPGMIHGVLFCIFCYALFDAMRTYKWKLITPALIFLASLMPFAFIWAEIWMKSEQGKLKG